MIAVAACLVVLGGLLIAQNLSSGNGSAPGTQAAAAGVTASGSASSLVLPSAAAASGSASGSASATASASVTPTATATTATPSASPKPTGKTASGSVPVAGAGQRTLTMTNRLQQTIWPAVAADPNHPVAATGWVLAPGASLTIVIPDHWDVRVWARTGCVFNSSGTGHCVTGDCQGKFQCGSTWGEFPDTLAEFNLNAWNGMDFYDVSLVEGNNLPMWINSSGGQSTDKINANGCSAAGCTKNANETCPAALQRTYGGQVVACLSSCLALGGDQMCCQGAYVSRTACDPTTWPVDSAAVFKKAEPFAYSYVDDDATSVLTCTGECNYRITWGTSS
ncbi:MAG TPA: thaumatin family protein [Actinocrinis sp.]|nr:thaumatin family protein [Actinocrinis sp.]